MQSCEKGKPHLQQESKSVVLLVLFHQSFMAFLLRHFIQFKFADAFLRVVDVLEPSLLQDNLREEKRRR